MDQPPKMLNKKAKLQNMLSHQLFNDLSRLLQSHLCSLCYSMDSLTYFTS